jgi:hypothetical protein
MDMRLDITDRIRHCAGMAARSNPIRLLVVLAVAAPLVAFDWSSVGAACVTGEQPTASVTGVVESTRVNQQEGVLMDVTSDDGTTRRVVFWGRIPASASFNGVENTWEDAWVGKLPEPGGRYAISGYAAGDGSIGMTACLLSSSVDVLSPPPMTTTPIATTSSPSPSTTSPAVASSVRREPSTAAETPPTNTTSTGAVVAGILGGILGLGALIVAVRRRFVTHRP